MATASSSEANGCIVTTGPKTSFWTISASCATSVTIVGATKKPRSPTAPPPVTTVALASCARSRKPSTRCCCSAEMTGPMPISSSVAGSPTDIPSTAVTLAESTSS